MFLAEIEGENKQNETKRDKGKSYALFVAAIVVGGPLYARMRGKGKGKGSSVCIGMILIQKCSDFFLFHYLIVLKLYWAHFIC